MTRSSFKSWRRAITVSFEHKCYRNICYFFLLSIPPQCITILLIQFLGMFLTSRDFHPILVCSNLESGDNWSNDSFWFLKRPWYPQLNAGSSAIPLTVTYSTTSTGFDSFKSFNGIHCSDLFLHDNRKLYLAVVWQLSWFPLIVTYWFSFFTAYLLFLWWFMMSTNIISCLPNWLTLQDRNYQLTRLDPRWECR